MLSEASDEGAHLSRLHPANRTIERLRGPDPFVASRFPFSRHLKKWLFRVPSPTNILKDTYLSLDLLNPALTRMDDPWKPYTIATRHPSIDLVKSGITHRRTPPIQKMYVLPVDQTYLLRTVHYFSNFYHPLEQFYKTPCSGKFVFSITCCVEGRTSDRREQSPPMPLKTQNEANNILSKALDTSRQSFSFLDETRVGRYPSRKKSGICQQHT